MIRRDVRVDFENLLMFFCYVVCSSLVFCRGSKIMLREPLVTWMELLQRSLGGLGVGDPVLSFLVNVLAWREFFQLAILVMKDGLAAVLWMVPLFYQSVTSCPQW